MESDNWAVIYGNEVEGRLAGTPSLFVGLETSVQDLEKLVVKHSVTHVFFQVKHLLLHGFEVAQTLHALRPDLTITLAALPDMAIPEDLHDCHIMLTLYATKMARLKPSDTLRVVAGQQHVYTVTKKDMLEAVPQSYAADKEATL